MRHKRALGAMAALTAATVLTGVPRLSSAQSANTWSTFHGDAARDGFSTLSGPRSSAVANQWQLPRGIASSPVVDAGGTAYVGDNDGNVYAFTPSNPTGPKWSFTTGGPVVDAPSLSPDGKTLYVGSDDGAVYALNTSDGSKVWTHAIGGAIEGSPVVSSDGATIYESNLNGTIVALKASDGSVAWSTPINGAIPGSMALSPDGSNLYVGTSTDYMYAVATGGTTPGQAVKPYYLDAPAHGSPAVDKNGNIYITTNAGSLMAFAPGTSTATWTFALPTPASTNSTPAIGNGVVVFGDGDGVLYGINPSNGQVVWTQRNVPATTSSPAIAGGNSTIYVGSDTGTVWAVDTTGAQVWDKPTGAAVVSSPAIGPDGSVWIGSQSGILYRFQSNVITPPPPPNTPVPGATSTPTPTATATPAPTGTPVKAVTPLSFSLRGKVKDGTKQVVTIHSKASTVIHIVVTYPNGMRQFHTGKTNAKGTLTYQYYQGSSKTTHNRYGAKVTVSASGAKTVSKTYHIQLGHIDVSIEPRTVRINHTFNVWIHSSRYTPTITRFVSTNHHSRRLVVRTGRNGWAHVKIRVSGWLPRNRKPVRVHVYSQTNGKHRPGYTTSVFFTITK